MNETFKYNKRVTVNIRLSSHLFKSVTGLNSHLEKEKF